MYYYCYKFVTTEFKQNTGLLCTIKLKKYKLVNEYLVTILITNTKQ